MFRLVWTRRLALIPVLLGVFAPVLISGPPVDASPIETFAESWRWRLFDRREGLASSSVSALHQDRQEYIYVATESGVSRYDFWEWSVLENSEPFDDGEVSCFIESPSALFALTQNVIWKVRGGATLSPLYRGGGLHAALNDLGDIFVIDSKAGHHLAIHGELLDRLDDVRLPTGKVLSYEIDSSRIHWLATSDGLFQRDLARRSWREVEERDLGSGLADRKCVSFFRLQARENPLNEAQDRMEAKSSWVSLALFVDPRSSGQILARLDGSTWTQTAALSGSRVKHMMRDTFGNQIASTEDGHLLLSQDAHEWKAVLTLGVGRTELYGGLLDSSGILWFATSAGGVASFDARSRAWEALPTGTREAFPKVFSILETDSGDVWVGMARGVARLRQGEPPLTWERVLDVPLEKVTGLAVDSLQRVWISSAESFNGAFHFDSSGEEGWSKEEHDGFKDHPIRRIVADRSGELWFLSKEPLPEGGYTIYRLGLSTAHELAPTEVPHGPVNDLVQAHKGGVWLATDEGLIHAILEGDRLVADQQYTNKNGLLSSQVWAVTEAADGAIWVCYPSSGGGVTRIQDGEVKSFQYSDGLASPDVWSIAAVGSSIWFGTGRGLSRFDGECFYSHPIASMDFRSIRVWPITASRRDPDCLLLGTYGQGVFKYRQEDRRRPRFIAHQFPAEVPRSGNVTFEWDARDYRNQTPHDLLLYRNRLDGGAWTRFGGGRAQDFKGLAPGQHTFEVQVRDSAGNRNREDLLHVFKVGRAGGTGSILAWLGIGAGMVGAALVAYWMVRRLRGLRRAQRYRRAFTDCPSAVFIVDADGRILEWNGKGNEVVGVDGMSVTDILGRPLSLLPIFFGDDLKGELRGLLRGVPMRRKRRVPGPAGTLGRIAAIQGFPIESAAGRAVVIVEDETSSAQREILNERERRLSSLRHLAGWFLCDFGDTLGKARRDGGASLELVEGLERLETIARKLSYFAGEMAPESMSTNTSDVSGLLERILGGSGSSPTLRRPSGVKVDYRAQPGLWSVSMDEVLLAEALLEVLRNAVDALGDGGTLSVRAQNIRLEDDPGLLSPGAYVEVLVKDSGVGMDPVQLDRLFEPFYSTKPRTQALGVGLASAYGIIRAHRGDIRVESKTGQGTTVRILLPASHSGQEPRALLA